MEKERESQKNGRREIGARLRRIRKEKGLTQKLLADETGLEEAHIGRIERGEIDCKLSTLLCVCRGLDIDPAQLLSHEYANTPIDSKALAYSFLMGEIPEKRRAAIHKQVLLLCSLEVDKWTSREKWSLEQTMERPRYELTRAQVHHPVHGSYTSYGLVCHVRYADGAVEQLRLPDISSRRRVVQMLRDMLNDEGVASVHFADVVEDFIANDTQFLLRKPLK